MLQLLYPCSQYSPDKCMLCGGSFRDHLALWWSKHLYTPFDRLVDRVYRDGVVQQLPATDPAYSISKQRSGTKMQHDASLLTKEKSAQTDFCFHRRYVLDITHLLQGVTDKREQPRIVQRAVAKQFPHVPKDRMEQRKRLADAVGTPPIVYAVPKVTANEEYVHKSRPTTIVTWFIVKEMFLSAIENLIDLEETDRERSHS